MEKNLEKIYVMNHCAVHMKLTQHCKSPMCVYVCSVTSDSLLTPWTIARQAPLPMEFSKQDYWNRLPFPISGNLLDPEIKLKSLASPALAGGFFITVPPRKPKINYTSI